MTSCFNEDTAYARMNGLIGEFGGGMASSLKKAGVDVVSGEGRGEHRQKDLVLR